MANVEVVSLSLNQIKTLRPFSSCKMLRELYLRKNCISDFEEINHLQDLPCLEVLWLSENPCADKEGYRDYVIRTLPQLKKLDNIDIEVPNQQLKNSTEEDPEDETKRADASRRNDRKSVEVFRKVEARGQTKARTSREDLLQELEVAEDFDLRHSREPSYHDDYLETDSRRIPEEQTAPLGEEFSSYSRSRRTSMERKRSPSSYEQPHKSSQTNEFKLMEAKREMEKRQLFIQHNILNAALSLIETLDETGLRWMRKEIDARLMRMTPKKQSQQP